MRQVCSPAIARFTDAIISSVIKLRGELPLKQESTAAASTAFSARRKKHPDIRAAKLRDAPYFHR
jgi:hypothetical protein